MEKTEDKSKGKEGVEKDDEKKPGKQEEELSEEDKELMENLNLLVERVQDADPGVQKLALETLKTTIKTSTSSMTSVPKPLKFLRPHYPVLKEFFGTVEESPNKASLGDVLSILAMTMAPTGSRESLHFKLRGNPLEIGDWGHEFVRNIAGEVADEFQARQEKGESVEELLELAFVIVPFNMKHNAEHEACDLLMELEKLPEIVQYVDETNLDRVCLYLEQSANYVVEPEDTETRKVVLDIFRKHDRIPEAFQMAIRLNDLSTVTNLYESCKDSTLKKQLAFILARQYLFFDEDDEDLAAIMHNTNLSRYFLELARDLSVTEVKTPEEIYKSHLVGKSSDSGTTVDSARENLASTFVNALLNAGFCNDKLMSPEDSKWVYRNKEHGMMSAAASLGMIYMWDVDVGLSEIDKYTHSKEDYIRAGALLAVGVVNSGIRHEMDPALALLMEHVVPEDGTSESTCIRVGAILGMGIAYAGSARDEIRDLLLQVWEEPAVPMEVVCFAALALGMVFVGSGDGELTEQFLMTLMEKDEASLKSTHTRFLSLALGLLYLGKQELSEVAIETLKIIPGDIGKYALLTVETCAYAGTGNVLKIQKLLRVCGEHMEKDSGHQAVAVLGISLIAMGEDIGRAMAVRTFNRVLQYGDAAVRKAVPLALGLLYVSDPQAAVVDTLSKLSHDADADVAQGAIIAMGLIGAGSNNARIANLLRNLSDYYAKEPLHLFAVRLGQGLLHMGKGTISIGPYHSHGRILHHVAMSGLLVVAHSCLDMKNLILGKSHYLLYSLACAMYPRMLMTFDEDLNPLNVTARVGQAVDVVGLAGTPKTISGSQTHSTPVLIGYGERAELATEKYEPLTSTLEGLVILRKAPEED